MDDYKPGHTIPACQVQLVWSKVDEHPKELSYMIHVTGVIPSNTCIRVTRNPALQGQGMNVHLQHVFEELHNAVFLQLHIQSLYINIHPNVFSSLIQLVFMQCEVIMGNVVLLSFQPQAMIRANFKDQLVRKVVQKIYTPHHRQ